MHVWLLVIPLSSRRLRLFPPECYNRVGAFIKLQVDLLGTRHKKTVLKSVLFSYSFYLQIKSEYAPTARSGKL